MTDDWRCFVGVPVPEQLRGSLAADVARLRRMRPELDDDWRWLDPSQWHVTLAFLGDTEPASIERLALALDRAAESHAPFIIPTAGIGVFPSPRAARVLWHGILDPDGRLAGLGADLRQALGLDVAPLSAHLTFGRSRHRRGAEVNGLLREAHLAGGEMRVDRAVLFRSHRDQRPAHYEVLAESLLGTRPAGP
jgi:2'-5' RNA ligase